MKVARSIFEETLENFSLKEGSEEYLKFEGDLRNNIPRNASFQHSPGLANPGHAFIIYTEDTK